MIDFNVLCIRAVTVRIHRLIWAFVACLFGKNQNHMLYILNVTICIQCGVFAFSHDTLKERFYALAMNKMHIYGIFLLDVIFVTSTF